MTVSELIEELYKHDGGATVYLPCATGGDIEITSVDENDRNGSDEVYLS